MTNGTPGQRSLSRVFIIENRAGPANEPEYQDCMMAGAIDQSLGDVTPIKCPSPDQFGRFDTRGQFQAEESRPTIPLTALYSLDIVSILERLKRIRCPYDVQVLFGTCTDPTDIDTFKKKVIFESGISTSYSTDELGALEDADNAKINETSDVSGEEFFSVVPLTVTARGGDVVTNPLEDVVICSRPECGDCDDPDDGCEIIYAVGDSSPGSPGTAPDLIWSINSGVTLNADEITTLTNSENADAVACVGLYVVVVSNDDGGIHYKLKSVVNVGTAANWTRNATNIASGGEPNDIWSVGTYAFIVGDGGYIYGISNPASITVLDAAQATTSNLHAVHALNRNFAVAVGAAGTVVRTENRTAWSTVTAPAAVTLDAVWIINQNLWWVGATNGAVYYTADGGTTWTQFTDFPVTFTTVRDIGFSSESVGYIAGAQAGPAGVILRTTTGGNSWVLMQEFTGSIPANDEVRAVAACKYDNNFMVAVGLGDDAADGYYVTAS